MTKKQFIQAVIVACKPAPGRVEAGINYAEKVWDILTARGYGASKPSGPREVRKHYDELTQYQKAGFDKFWNAFDYKHGMQRAALAWSKLGEPPEAEYKKIVEAAAREAARPRTEKEVRKMAEGWLNDGRFDDETLIRKPATNNKQLEISRLLNEQKQLERLDEATPTDAFKQRIGEIDTVLAELRNR